MFRGFVIGLVFSAALFGAAYCGADRAATEAAVDAAEGISRGAQLRRGIRAE